MRTIYITRLLGYAIVVGIVIYIIGSLNHIHWVNISLTRIGGGIAILAIILNSFFSINRFGYLRFFGAIALVIAGIYIFWGISADTFLGFPKLLVAVILMIIAIVILSSRGLEIMASNKRINDLERLYEQGNITAAELEEKVREEVSH